MRKDGTGNQSDPGLQNKPVTEKSPDGAVPSGLLYQIVINPSQP